MTLEELETAKTLAWQYGRLNYKMRRTQLKIKSDWEEAKKKSRKFYIESTRRLGKSSLLLLLFTEECLRLPNRKCGFFAPVKEGLLDYVEPLIAKTYEDCPQELVPRFDKQRFILNFKNGSTIIFRGSNNQQHRVRRGQEFNVAGIDEARDVDNLNELVESVVFPSLFSTDGYMIISSTPADTRSHPLYSYRQTAEVEGWLTRLTIWDANKYDPDVYSKDRIDEWKRETSKGVDGEEVWKREYECDWIVNKSRAAVPEWKQEYAIEIPRDPYYQFYQHYVAIDWGYRDFTAVGFGTYCFRAAKLQIESEMTFSGTEVRADRIAEAIHRQAVKLWGQDYEARMVSDSADPILINELNIHPRMNFVPVAKEHTLEAMLNQFRGLVDQGKILVSPKCTLTIHCLANGIWNEKRTKLDQDVFARHFDHLMQLVYMTRVVDMATNPIPADYMVDGVRLVEMDWDRKTVMSESANALQEAFSGRRIR